MTKKLQVSKNRKHPWDEIDPQIFNGKISMKQLAERYQISYRQVTNRKYNLRDKVKRIIDSGDEKALTKFLRYLKVKDVSKIPMLGNS